MILGHRLQLKNLNVHLKMSGDVNVDLFFDPCDVVFSSSSVMSLECSLSL